MDISVMKTHGSKALAALFALTTWAGTMQATNVLTATTLPSPATVTCNTATGPGTAATIVIKPVAVLAGSSTIAVTFTAPGAGLVVTAPGSPTLTVANQSAGLTYTVNVTAGCVGASTGATTVHFAAGGTADVTATVNDTVVSTASALVAAPVTVTCARSAGPVYTPGPAQTVPVTSAAVGGTPFTVDTSVVPPPAWLTVTGTGGGTASATAVTFTVVAAAGCGAFASGTSNVATLHLLNAPAPDKLVAVTLQVVPPSILTAAPNPVSLSYIKGSGTAGYVDVRLTSASSPAPFFAVNTASLPIWLTVDSTTGTVPKSLRFSSTSVCDTLAPGTYTATIYVKVSGYADLALPVSLLLNNKAPRLSVAEGTTRSISWTLGTALPAPYITAISTDSPIAYTAATGGTLAPIISASEQAGLAYNFGTQIGVTFNPLIFAAAQPGSVLTGTVTLTWGTPASTIVVTFNITVLAPGATLSGLTPASLPTAPSGQTFTVVVIGTGFVTSTDLAQKTKVGIVVGGSIVTDTNIAANVVNPSNIILTFTVPAVADANLPFSQSGAGGPVVLGICNPAGTTCSIPSGTATLTIGSGPIIQAVTSASAYTEVTPPALPSLAPYDMISIFGANFCSSGGTGCSTSQILYGAPDPVTQRFPSSLSPDAVSGTQRLLTVTFQTHGSTPTAIATAPLLIATNGQINLLVPAAVFTYIGSTVDIVVNFGYGSGATMKSSAPFDVNVVATDPGIFTVGADGQGDGAILNSNWAQITVANPVGMRSTGADSDTVQLYVTGLGTPDSIADNGSAGSGFTWSADCVTTGSYLISLNAATSSSLPNIDGTIMQSSLFNANRLPPCVVTTSPDLPSVTVGGVAGTVVYAGFVANSIAGLYQVNVTLPATSGAPFTTASGASITSITAPVQLPVVVTANGVASQTGVTVWVAPRLKVTGPSGGGLSGTVGVPWPGSSNVVIATEGTSPYRYALTSGLLPAGVTLNAATGAISGTPAANTAGSYIVTVTATDAANVPLTGTATFTLTVAGGLFTTSSGSAPYNGTFGTANAALTTVIATGGVFPYGYAITSPVTLPTGMTITPLTGSITFDIVVALHMSRTGPVGGAHGVASAISTVQATGATGSVSYALDGTTLGLGWVTIDSSTGIVSITTGAPASTTITATVTATDGTVAPGAASAGTGTITVTVAVT